MNKKIFKLFMDWIPKYLATSDYRKGKLKGKKVWFFRHCSRDVKNNKVIIMEVTFREIRG